MANQGNSTITVYDEKGDQVKTAGGFPDVDEPGSIAYDPLDNLLYVTMNGHGANSILVYDMNGHELAGCGFPIDGGIGLAFDPVNRHLYVADFGTLPDSGFVHVYDQAGHSIKTSGSFPLSLNPTAIALDTHNHRLYVAELNGTGPHFGGEIDVFDEDGHTIATDGVFPSLSSPDGIAFDPQNDRLYVTNPGPFGDITVYDADGNLVSSFPFVVPGGGAGPNAIAFDESNTLLYAVNFNNTATAYDQSGNVVPATGGFPNLNNPSGIVTVPK